MDTFFGILLIIFLVIVLFWPYLNKWLGPMLQRWMIGRLEDRMRRMAGMPTRKEERKMRKETEKARKKGAAGGWDAFRDRRNGHEDSSGGRRGPIIPKDYAEDVEFVEIKSYSEETVVRRDAAPDGGERIVVESQIEDVEFTEIVNEKK